MRSHDKYWKNISDDAKAFIRALVKPNPGDRPTAEQALKHKWIIDALNKEHEHDLAATFKENWYACPSRLLPTRAHGLTNLSVPTPQDSESQVEAKYQYRHCFASLRASR